MILRVKHHDPDVQRKGRVLAAIILVMATGMVALAIFNILNPRDPNYYVSNGIFLLFIGGLFWLNRSGYVTLAGIITVVLTTMSSIFLLSEDTTLSTTFVVMCIPVLLASFLIVPWSGFVITSLLIAGTIVSGISPGDYP